MPKFTRGRQVAVLSVYDLPMDWQHNVGVFCDKDHAYAYAALFGAREWREYADGPLHPCMESQVGERLWVLEEFIVEPPPAPVGKRNAPK